MIFLNLSLEVSQTLLYPEGDNKIVRGQCFSLPTSLCLFVTLALEDAVLSMIRTWRSTSIAEADPGFGKQQKDTTRIIPPPLIKRGSPCFS